MKKRFLHYQVCLILAHLIGPCLTLS
jgi:hypothetical protein